MKTLRCLLLLASLAFEMLAEAFPRSSDHILYRAREHGALARECLRVVDQDGLPVADAKVWGGLQTGGNLRDFTPISGVTDTNGEYVIQGKCTNRIRCDIANPTFHVRP